MKYVLSRMPGLTAKIKDLDRTVATLVECYGEDFGGSWMIQAAKEEREWVYARQGKPVLTAKKDGNKTVLNWFRMKAADYRDKHDGKTPADQKLATFPASDPRFGHKLGTRWREGSKEYFWQPGGSLVFRDADLRDAWHPFDEVTA